MNSWFPSMISLVQVENRVFVLQRKLKSRLRTTHKSIWFRLQTSSSEASVSAFLQRKKRRRKKSSAHMAVCASKIQPALVRIKVRQINRLIFKCCPNSQGQSKVQLIAALVAGTSAPWVFDFPGRCWTPAAVTRHFVRFVSRRFPVAAPPPWCEPAEISRRVFSSITHSSSRF